MNPWLEAALAGVAAAMGVILGLALTRRPGPQWWLGYLAPMAVVTAFSLAVRRPDLAGSPALGWVFMGRWKFAVMAAVVALLLTTLGRQLPRLRDRHALALLGLATIVYTSLWPSLAAAVNRGHLAALTTTFPPDGVCRQSTDYTCGPAAAVTVLRRLGLPAEEGDLAVLAGTSTATGTPPDTLAQALNKRYGRDGLQAELRSFHDLAELRAAGPAVVLVKFSLFLDHWLAITEITDQEVVVGDPLSGPARLTHAEFNGRWRRIGIVLHRGAEPGVRRP